MSKINYHEWFEKYHGKSIDGMDVHINLNKDIDDGRCVVTFFDKAETYTAVINTISAYSEDRTRALPCFTNESEVDLEFKNWSRHAKESLSQ